MQQTLPQTIRSGPPLLVAPPSGPAVPQAVAHRPPRTRVPGMSLLVVLVGYPVLWALGVQVAAWPAVAVLLGVWLVARRGDLVVPRGFGLWLLFLGWTVVSALALEGFDRYFAWGFRETLYLSATVVLVFLVNAPSRLLPSRLLALSVLALWAATVLTGLVGVLVPDLSFRSLAEMVLPSELTDVQFVRDQIHPDFGNSTELLGVSRPSALYSYTNSWGAVLGVLVPFAVYSKRHLRSPWAHAAFWVVLAVSVVPIVVSVNRGLWVSIVVACLFIAVRGAMAGRPAVLAGVLLSAAGAAAVVYLSPLWDVLQHRLDTPNTGTRETLVGASFELASRSPIIGYGAPVTVTTIADTNDVSIGTHGQLWTLLVSHGYPGVAFYFGFFLVTLVVTWKLAPHAWWLQATIVVFLIQSPFYNALPVPLVLAMMAVALCLRENGLHRSATGARTPHQPGGPLAARPLSRLRQHPLSTQLPQPLEGQRP